ncbi:hypothetical protein ACIOD2_49650 [Amycolatopsis sp. NPDC088138]|uniref:hypothetical protein n=1 Tax=Amycolatopsis sp. NPDC088138 TaxID=3363938 RepID=UPI0037FB6116
MLLLRGGRTIGAGSFGPLRDTLPNATLETIEGLDHFGPEGKSAPLAAQRALDFDPHDVRRESAEDSKPETGLEEQLVAQLTKRLVESALEGEVTDHLGCDKRDPAGRGTGNSRNGAFSPGYTARLTNPGGRNAILGDAPTRRSHAGRERRDVDRWAPAGAVMSNGEPLGGLDVAR